MTLTDKDFKWMASDCPECGHMRSSHKSHPDSDSGIMCFVARCDCIQHPETPDYHRQREWEGYPYDTPPPGGMEIRVTFVARVYDEPDDAGSHLDFGGVGDMQGTVGSRLESGKMVPLGFRAVIVEGVDVYSQGKLIPNPMFTPEGGI